MHEVFISYSRHDAPAANALADTLSGAGLTVWLDRNAIQEGDAFDTQIEEAIAQTRVVIVIWSKESVKSHWVRAEAAYALGKHKLLPITIDQSEPPLQFLQIQSIDFRYWDRSTEHYAFRQLTAAITKRLERASPLQVGATASAATPQTRPAGPAGAAKFSLQGVLHHWLAKAGLRFAENVVEMEYRDYFREKTYIIAQFAMLLAAVTYVIYGVADMAMELGGVLSTRFRFMLAIPLMGLFFGLSFRPFCRRHSQLFICCFGIVAAICTYTNVMLIAAELPFRIENGNATMNSMLLLAFLALLPITLANTIMLGLVVCMMHGAIVMHSGLPLANTWLFYLHVSSAFTVACCIAYWRERFYRTSFAAQMS